MELLIRLLLALLFLVVAFLGIESDVSQPVPVEPPDGETFRQPILIDSVQAVAAESLPVQVTLDVSGSIQDGCNFPVITEISQAGTTITVDIYRDVPLAAMCPMMIQPYNESIPLGFMEPGSYTITVND
ncbi:MAG: hypothetical protein AAFR56_03735, partial [Chloroflexota bacterium]